MVVEIVDHIDQPTLAQAVRLHDESLAYRSFITIFGRGFLQAVYEALLQDRLGYLVLAREGNELKGFMLICTGSDKLMTSVWKRAHVFVPLVCKVLVRSPHLLKNVIETFFYSRRQDGLPPQPEILVITVEKDCRGQGIGTRMIQAFERDLLIKTSLRYKVTVHKDMAPAVHFYERQGMSAVRNFQLYGYTWQVFNKEIGAKGNG